MDSLPHSTWFKKENKINAPQTKQKTEIERMTPNSYYDVTLISKSDKNTTKKKIIG